MSNLLKYTVPVWNDLVYDYKYFTLDIKTCDSVIRIFGMLNEDSANEALMSKIINGNSITISRSKFGMFAGGNDIDLEAVYNT